MPVIGELIKKAIDITGILKSDPEPELAQENVLKKLLEKAKYTAFGKKYDFEDLLVREDVVKAFQQHVPIFDYDQLNAQWWHYLREGHENVTWPGGQKYFALSSGTTSNSKAIPVTDDMLEATRKSALEQIISLKNFDLPPEFFQKQILMLGSSTQLKANGNFLEGEISGISAGNIPAWFKSFYKPGLKISAIPEWDQKVKKIAKEAPKWDIGSLSGIPAWIELMLKEIIDYHQLENIHEIWPNLMVYTSGGVAFEPYRKSLEKLLAHPLIYIDTYLTSEGYLATQRRPGTSSMTLSVDNGFFFEFVPFEDKNMDENGAVKQDAEVLTLAQAEENKDYVLLITTVSGAWRYMIGDTVMITDKSRSEIKITGRTKHFLNVVGSQLSVHQMNKAIQQMEKEFDMSIREFVVGAVHNEDGEYIHQWILGSNQKPDELLLAQKLDAELSENNKNYKVARSKALKGVSVEIVPIDRFYLWSEEFKKLGGQAKIPRVMKEEELLEFKNFVCVEGD